MSCIIVYQAFFRILGSAVRYVVGLDSRAPSLRRRMLSGPVQHPLAALPTEVLKCCPGVFNRSACSRACVMISDHSSTMPSGLPRPSAPLLFLPQWPGCARLTEALESEPRFYELATARLPYCPLIREQSSSLFSLLTAAVINTARFLLLSIASI